MKVKSTGSKWFQIIPKVMAKVLTEDGWKIRTIVWGFWMFVFNEATE